MRAPRPGNIPQMLYSVEHCRLTRTGLRLRVVFRVSRSYIRSEDPDQVGHRIHPGQPPQRKGSTATWCKKYRQFKSTPGWRRHSQRRAPPRRGGHRSNRFRTQEDRHRRRCETSYGWIWQGHLTDLCVGATIGLREARKWRGRSACGVIVNQRRQFAKGTH